MNVTAQKLQSLYAPVGNHWHESTIGRHSLSHALAGVPAPSEREPGGVRTIHPTARKPEGYGRFSSPLRNSKEFTFYHSTDDTPSASHLLSSSLREGAGDELHHSSYRPETARFRAIFIAPTKAQKSLRFTIQRTTLSQSWSQCSRASSFDFRAIPPAYPVRFPFVPMTRWHGIMMDIGL